MWGVLDPPISVFSLSLYRHPFLYTLFTSRFTLIINNNTILTSLCVLSSKRFVHDPAPTEGLSGKQCSGKKFELLTNSPVPHRVRPHIYVYTFGGGGGWRSPKHHRISRGVWFNFYVLYFRSQRPSVPESWFPRNTVRSRFQKPVGTWSVFIF
jgi:hypothetical protein